MNIYDCRGMLGTTHICLQIKITKTLFGRRNRKKLKISRHFRILFSHLSLVILYFITKKKHFTIFVIFNQFSKIISYQSSLCSHSTKCDKRGVSVDTGKSILGYITSTLGLIPASYSLKLNINIKNKVVC